jgi:hypothetical protein
MKIRRHKKQYLLILPVLSIFFSGCEQPSNTRLPETPEQPRVISGDRQLKISWNRVSGASAYEVWLGKGESIAMAELYRDSYVSETSITITGLDNYNTYYIWIRALNNAGTGNFSLRAQGVPGGTAP